MICWHVRSEVREVRRIIAILVIVTTSSFLRKSPHRHSRESGNLVRQASLLLHLRRLVLTGFWIIANANSGMTGLGISSYWRMQPTGSGKCRDRTRRPKQPVSSDSRLFEADPLLVKY